MRFGFNSLPEITADELKAKLAVENVTLLDVRTPREWNQTGVIPGSIMVEMKSIPNELNNGLSLEGKEPIVVICKSGVRSGQVAKYLINNHNIQAVNLKGGVIAWNKIEGEFERI